MTDFRRPRRLSSDLDDLPGLFDYVDISRDDIAGDIIVRKTAVTEPADPELPDIPETQLVPRNALQFISFGSGSSGNCAFIGTSKGGVLIDAGVDGKYVTEQLLHNGIDAGAVRGILLTHDHSDHVKYAYSLLRYNRNMRLFCTPKTLNGLLRRHNISRRIKDYHTPIYKEFPFEIGGMTITAFEVSHDGTDNVGFAFETGEIKMVILTDSGYITERADFYMHDADALMIEANYDAEMLMHGPYPEHLKARIASRSGHLDNTDTAAYLARIVSPKLRNVFLCHLSHDNNCPEIALATVRTALRSAGAKLSDNPLDEGTNVCVLPRFAASSLFIISKNHITK